LRSPSARAGGGGRSRRHRPPANGSDLIHAVTLVWAAVGSEDGVAMGDGFVLTTITMYLADFVLNPLTALANPGFTDELRAAPTITEVTLAPITPNPNHGLASIAFALPHAMPVHLALFDLQGRQLDVIADRVFEAGPHNVMWSAPSERSGRAAGVYFVQMVTTERTLTRRMVVQ
jgi:hypothetical protein